MDSELIETERKTSRALAIGVACVIIIFISPIAIADLVYGFSGDECLNEYPEDIHLNLKKYLIVSGFTTIGSISYIIYNLCVISDKKEIPIWLMVMNIVFVFFSQVFTIIWNIIGAVIFWNFIYPEGECKSTTSNYLFTSIIIKLVMIYINLLQTTNKKE